MLFKVFTILTTVSIFLIGSTSQAQSTDSVPGRNEIRLNIPLTIAGLLELNYERLVENNVGVGLAMATAIDNPDRMPYRSQFMPYGRLYFGKKFGAGFFIEVNAIGTRVRDIYNEWYLDSTGNYIYTKVDESRFCFGFGAAAGVKLITWNGYVGEIYAGGGRLFGNAPLPGYYRAGITLGKRF